MNNLLRPQIILESTGALGDTVIATALIPALDAAGFETGHICSPTTFPLWHGLPHASAYYSDGSLPAHALVVNLCDYLSLLPHTTKPYKHLCAYMRLYLSARLADQGIFLSLPHVSQDHVQVHLSLEEWLWGKQVVKQLSQADHGKPVLVLAPCATTNNRWLDPLTVAAVAASVRTFCVPVLLDPLPAPYQNLNIQRLGTSDLRRVAALLGVVDGFISVDSGPFHLAVAARQGVTSELKEQLKMNARLQSVILIVGSSHPAVISYRDVQTLFSPGECPISPCGMHGYGTIEVQRKAIGRPVYVHPKNTSGCIYADYPSQVTTRCMRGVSVPHIVEAVNIALNNCREGGSSCRFK